MSVSDRVVLFRPPEVDGFGCLLPAQFFKVSRSIFQWRKKQLDLFPAVPEANTLRSRLKKIVAVPPTEKSLRLVHSSQGVRGSALGPGLVGRWHFCACTDGSFWDRVKSQAVQFRLSGNGALSYAPEDPTFIGVFPNELETALHHCAKAA